MRSRLCVALITFVFFTVAFFTVSAFANNAEIKKIEKEYKAAIAELKNQKKRFETLTKKNDKKCYKIAKKWVDAEAKGDDDEEEKQENALEKCVTKEHKLQDRAVGMTKLIKEMGKGFYTKETLKEWKKYEKATDKCMKPRENFSQKFGEIVMKMGIRAEKVFIKEVKTFLDNEGNCIQKEATKLRKKLKARRKEIEAALLKSAKGTRNKATK